MPIDIATFKPENAADVFAALAQEAAGVLTGQWAQVEADLRPYMLALSRAVVDVQKRLASGEFNKQQADYALHGQELALNSFLQYVDVVTYATAQKLLNMLFETAAKLIENVTGFSLSWL